MKKTPNHSNERVSSGQKAVTICDTQCQLQLWSPMWGMYFFFCFCVLVLWPNQPTKVRLNWSVNLLTLLLGRLRPPKQCKVHILLPVTDNCPFWISRRGKMANILIIPQGIYVARMQNIELKAFKNFIIVQMWKSVSPRKNRYILCEKHTKGYVYIMFPRQHQKL